MDKEELYIELQNINNRGITLFLEGRESNPQAVADVLCVQEETSYMRDYIYDKGVLKELHFDKVKNQ